MAKIIQNKGSHKILAILTGLDGKNPLQLIELAGRTAYQSRDKITQDSAKKFVEMIRKLGHESVLEHSAMTVEFNNISRGFSHEIVRHRLASFTQESTRYVDKSNFVFILPPHKNQDKKIIDLPLPNGKKIKISVKDWVNMNENLYRALRKLNWPCEDARQFLPIGIKTQIVVTANFREWRHIFQLRCDPHAHWEIRQVMVNLLEDAKKLIPVIFDDFKIDKEKITAQIEK